MRKFMKSYVYVSKPIFVSGLLLKWKGNDHFIKKIMKGEIEMIVTQKWPGTFLYHFSNRCITACSN